jgi:arabinogalactan oligomer/maltooligosaccharide transport system permease protein
LLITWLYKIALGSESRYYMASVLGIVIFIIVSTITLLVYSRLGSNKNEGDMA